MIYKVGLSGASGKMGLEIASLLSEGFIQGSDTLELADAVTRSGRLTSIEGTETRRIEDPEREPVHVWIDFSRPEGTLALLAKTDTPVVIGTTGFAPEQLKEIESYATRRKIMLCPNTSPGMNLVTRMLRETPVPESLGFTAVLEEDHHRHKKDSPSGTAKAILEVLRQTGYHDVQVHVTRAGSIIGNHTVRFIADGEEIFIGHRVTDRKIFARGALLAAWFLIKQREPRLYRMEEVSRV